MVNRKMIEITIPGYDGTLYVTYSYSPGSPAVFYQRNGDPGWPADDAWVDIDFISFAKDGYDIFEILNDKAVEDVQNACMEYEEGYEEAQYERDTDD